MKNHKERHSHPPNTKPFLALENGGRFTQSQLKLDTNPHTHRHAHTHIRILIEITTLEKLRNSTEAHIEPHKYTNAQTNLAGEADPFESHVEPHKHTYTQTHARTHLESEAGPLESHIEPEARGGGVHIQH